MLKFWCRRLFWGASSSSSRVAVSPLFGKVHSKLLQASNQPRRNLSRLGRLAADREGEESHMSSPEAKSNGPSEDNPELGQSASSGPSAGVRSNPSTSQAVSPAVTARESPKRKNETGQRPQESSKSQPPPRNGKKLRKHCSWCKRTTGLATTFVCRCGSSFCGEHRYAELHSCSHDYKTEGRRILQKNNPVVVAAKVRKI